MSEAGDPASEEIVGRWSPEDVPEAMRESLFSVVIPVFNSDTIVGSTIDRTVGFFRALRLRFEIVCVNDGSQDGSWQVLKRKVAEHPEVVAVDLLRNYGQHNANLCGLRQARGDWVVTIDDDLQNPPEEIMQLMLHADAGTHDVVFGEFRRKRATTTRRIGTGAVSLINQRVFGQPSDLVVSNFRLIRRDVVDRIAADRSASPYITGLTLLYSRNPGNAVVEHAPRAEGRSTYTTWRIIRLVLTILFSYSAFPLRLFAMIGFVVATGAFVIGTVYLILGLTGRTQVEGWTSLIVLSAFLNGVTIAMVSMLGEYLVRTLNQTSAREPYHVAQTAGIDG